MSLTEQNSQLSAGRPKSSSSALPVYVSYAWGGASATLVDEIEQRLPSEFRLIRDKNEMRPGDWITRFMEEIGQAEIVIVVISEKYLKSHYCMRELLFLRDTSVGDKAKLMQRVISLIVGRVSCGNALARDK